MAVAASLCAEHLLLRLCPITRALRAAVERQGEAAARLVNPELTTMCVTNEHVSAHLDEVEALLAGASFQIEPTLPTAEETGAEQALRERASPGTLPLDRLQEELALSPFEMEALLICVASEVDRAYERIFAFIVDDLNRRQPCVELLAGLTAATAAERLERRAALGPAGQLRRLGLLVATAEAASELRQELRASPALLGFLLQGTTEPTSLFHDQGEVVVTKASPLPQGVEPEMVARLGTGVRSRAVHTVGVWGPRHSGVDDVVRALAHAAGKSLRRLPPIDPRQLPSEIERMLRHTTELAVACDALLWIEADRLTDSGTEAVREQVADFLAATPIPMVVSGVHPWRPTALLELRPYAELDLPSPSYAARRAMWAATLPEAPPSRVADLAARFRMGTSEMRAVAQVARTEARLTSNGHAAAVTTFVDRACATVIRKRCDQFAQLVMPRRGPDDLILPADLHHLVMEVARFYRVWPEVAERWGFGRLVSGGLGLKALFTGDSGTGKTLAAEVIAGELGLPLLRIDLARVVSKWVGETEKNLEAAFREAEESNSVLFFDEADALFGKRGEVRHGTDRYANLEASYLLQRLEEHDGLVILSSNLKDQIDNAFLRRFQVAVHFPRPGREERRRMWRHAFPPSTLLDEAVDLDRLAALEMTGAAIVASARTAALLAAADDGTIAMRHVVRAIERQYRQEARVLSAGELGPHATLLRGI
jgi:ATPase family protein associated with various cellular activities (AAA)/winged helix domain-containing protein